MIAFVACHSCGSQNDVDVIHTLKEEFHVCQKCAKGIRAREELYGAKINAMFSSSGKKKVSYKEAK